MKKLIRRPLSLVLALVMALTLAVPALAAPPTAISVAPQSASLTVGQTLTLTAKLTPEDADPTGLVWTSSAPEVASVSPEGVVTALAVGTAYIKYHPDGQDTPAGICIIAVSEAPVVLDPANDQLVLSDSEQKVQAGQYQTKVLKAPTAAVKNGQTDVTERYALTYTWTQDGQPLTGAETTLVTPAFQKDMSLTCTVTAVSKEDPQQILTAACTYQVEVLPGTMIEGVSYASEGPKALTAIYDLEGKISLMDQLTLGIEDSLETPAVPGLKNLVFFPETITGENVGSLNVTAGTIYSLSEDIAGAKFSDVIFSPAMEGTYTIHFKAYGSTTYYGQLTITVSGQTTPGDGAIRCTSTGFTFSGSNFSFDDPTDPIVAVTFGQPAVGALLRDFNKGQGTPANGERYYLDSSAYGAYHVSTLTYPPAPGYAGLVNLPVTYHTRSAKQISQTILVEVISKTTSDRFLDVTPSTVGTWAANSIDFAYDCGLINGVDATRFAPNSPMTRAMLVTVLYRAAGSPQVNTTTNFTDLNAGDYYYNAVVWANMNGIVTGTTGTTFAPNNPVTRQQIATILYRYAKTTGTVGQHQADLGPFTDRDSLEPYAVEPMAWAVGEGIISGTTPTTLSPLSQATRAQVAVMLHRYLV